MKKKILSVDDSSIIRKIVRGAVDRLDFDFAEAGDGQQALDLLDTCYADVALILLDWNMPVKDGFQTLEALKANPNFAPIPVMMVTTEAERENVVKAIKAGAKNYLTKPFSQEDLLSRMMECLGMAVC
jgi:two-component system, chemotaxis family, chemotaxis protein CheY